MARVVASHQIDILPYPGFWNRVKSSNIMDLGGLYDWFNKGSDYYHHRVKIGTDENWEWLTLPVEFHTGYRQCDVLIKNSLLHRCYSQLEKVYSKSPNWDLYKNYLYNTFCEQTYKYMWELNFKLLLWVRDILKLSTPLCIPVDTGTDGDATDKIALQMKSYGCEYYYCGKGGKNYLDEEKLKEVAGLTVQWQEYTAPDNYKTVSILSLIMDYPADTVKELI